MPRRLASIRGVQRGADRGDSPVPCGLLDDQHASRRACGWRRSGPRRAPTIARCHALVCARIACSSRSGVHMAGGAPANAIAASAHGQRRQCSASHACLLSDRSERSMGDRTCTTRSGAVHGARQEAAPRPANARHPPAQGAGGVSVMCNGSGEIRTHGTLSRTHTFQACALNHSATDPRSSVCASSRSAGQARRRRIRRSSALTCHDCTCTARPADRVRFELTIPLRVRRFSRPVLSTTQPPVRNSRGNLAGAAGGVNELRRRAAPRRIRAAAPPMLVLAPRPAPPAGD